MNFELSRLIKFVSPYKGTLLFAMILMLGGSVLSLANPWLAGRFTESLLSDSVHVRGLGSYLTPYQFPFALGEVRNSFAD